MLFYPSLASRLVPWLGKDLHAYRQFSDLIARMWEYLSVDELCCHVNGKKMWIQADDRWALRRFFRFRGRYDYRQIKVLSRFLSANTCYWDIGANYGTYFVTLSDFFHRDTRVVLMEPNVGVFRLLRRTVYYDTRDDLTVFPLNCAAGKRDGSGPLFLSRMGSADSRTYEPHDDDTYNYGKHREKVMVEIRSLDRTALDLFPDWPHDNVIKLDVQGHEYEVIQGAARLIDNSRMAVVFIEIWPHGLRQSLTDPTQLIGFFKDRGFRVLNEVGIPKSYDWLQDFVDSEVSAGGFRGINVILVKHPGRGL